LWVAVDQEDLEAFESKTSGEVDCGGGLAHTPFWFTTPRILPMGIPRVLEGALAGARDRLWTTGRICGKRLSLRQSEFALSAGERKGSAREGARGAEMAWKWLIVENYREFEQGNRRRNRAGLDWERGPFWAERRLFHVEHFLVRAAFPHCSTWNMGGRIWSGAGEGDLRDRRMR